MARGKRGALDEYLHPLQQALTCVTRAQVICRGHHPAAPFTIWFASGTAEKLRATPSLSLLVGEEINVIPSAAGRWRVETLAYEYTILDEGEREILSYQWHPYGRTGEESKVTFPHLHVWGRPDVGSVSFHKVHLPTGFATLPAVLRLAIAEFHVEPIRTDWDEVLARTQEIIERIEAH